MRKLVLLTAILSLAACRSDSGDDGGNNPDGGVNPGADAAPGTAQTIYDVQSDDTPVGASVTLRNVVVTAIDTFGGRTGGVYLQEQEGGPFSGVFVFVPASVSSALAVGDLVDLDGGIKDEFALQADDTGRTLTEVVSPEGSNLTITKLGSGTVPAPEMVNAWDLAADDAEAEKWEGVLISFPTVRALSAPFGVSQSDDTLKEMEITGPYRVGGSLTDLSDTIVRDDCFTSITGIGDYFFNYKILPRSAEDLSSGADGDCLPEEESEAMCMDDMDNDFDGFSDCADFSCQEAVAACTVDSTVVQTQNGTIEENTLVRLTDVVVTAVHSDNKKFFVQDAGGAAEFNGLFVFRPSTADDLPGTVLEGSVVTLKGNVDEFNGQLTELTNVVIEASAAPSATVEILSGVSMADLATDKKYEGVVVELSNVDVAQASENGCTEFCDFSVTDGTTTLFVNDDIFRTVATDGLCYGTLRGIMHFDDFNDRIVILPRKAQDVVPGCL